MNFNDVVHDWLIKRRITPSVQALFDVRAGHTNSMGDCIVIPVHDPEGKFLFNKYRRSPLTEIGEKYMYDKGGSAQLYGADKVKEGGIVLICEGELDALVAWSANIPAVSSTGGAMTFLEKWKDWFTGKEATICLDNDHAGGEGMARIWIMMKDAYILFLPDRGGVKDLTEYVVSGGDLNELMKTRKRFKGLEDVVSDRAERLATWHSTFFHDAVIRLLTEKPKMRKERIETDTLMRAKKYPIDEID